MPKRKLSTNRTLPKKRNPQDITLRNLRVMKTRHVTLEARVQDLEDRNMKYGTRIQRLEEQVRDLQAAMLKLPPDRMVRQVP